MHKYKTTIQETFGFHSRIHGFHVAGIAVSLGRYMHQLDEAMELHHLLNTWGVATKSQLEDVLNAAEQGDPMLMEKLLEDKEQRERKS